MPIPLLRFRNLDSTQDFLRRHPELGCCGVMAESQTAGRGRWGNRWEGAPGSGLYLSASLPDPGLPPGLTLLRAMGAVGRLLERRGARLGLKWPNDLVAWRGDSLAKVGGILGEVLGPSVILGLGLNILGAPLLPDGALPAVALSDLGVRDLDPLDLALEILEAWEDAPGEDRPLSFRWPAMGDPIRWEGGQGVVLDWEEDGRLRLANAGGILRLSAGEIRGLAPLPE